ncbi:MAG TPA: recombinase family protein [bacterium]|nr:recombinase family protein [bacterium]
MRAIGYVRVSTADQTNDGISLDVQTARIEAYAAMMNLELVVIIREEGVSASIPLKDRPGGKQVLAALWEQDVRHVVALKLDRLFRDAADCLTQTKEWDTAGIALHLVDMGGMTLNTASAMGRMFLTISAAFAELERNLISERTSQALQHKKSRGEPVGRPPFGFKMVDHRLVPIPEELAIIAEVKRQRAEGRTLWQIANYLREQNVPTRQNGAWRHNSVRQLLSVTETA